jgi:membrane fusion protein (multidrug efflux system)
MKNAPPEPENNQPIHDKKKILWGMTLGLLIISLLIFLLWFFILRFHQKTEDAYVNGNQVVLTPQIAGYITTVTVNDTQLVEAGHILVQLDTIDQTISLEKAKNDLAETVRNVSQMFQNVEKLKADVESRKAEMAKTGQDYEHRKKLVQSGAISVEDFQHSEASFIEAYANLLAAQFELNGAEALVAGTTVQTHPLVEKAKAATKDAFVNLQRCTIRSPVQGIVAAKQAQVGQAITPNTALMTLIPLDQIWVDANFKEGQLRKVRIGQPVKMTSDIYGSGITYHGKVVGIGAATGSVLSVLPPQNATGNWIKIVQRLPVRIRLDQDEIKVYPLRLGLSMNVNVDVHKTDGDFIPPPTPFNELYTTTVFEDQEAGADILINQIIADNARE